MQAVRHRAGMRDPLDLDDKPVIPFHIRQDAVDFREMLALHVRRQRQNSVSYVVYPAFDRRFEISRGLDILQHHLEILP